MQSDTDISNKRNIAVIGDSMLNGLHANGLRKSKDDNVKVYAHSGATTDDLVDHLNPVIKKNPDIIILHGGTNDLTNNVDTVKNIASMIRLVKRKCSKTELKISQIMT